MISRSLNLLDTYLNESDFGELDFDIFDDDFNLEFNKENEIESVTRSRIVEECKVNLLLANNLDSSIVSSSFTKKRKIIELESSIIISDEILNRWKSFPYKVIDVLNGGNIAQLTEYLGNYVDPKCVCQFFILGKTVLKVGPSAIVMLLQAVMNVYPDYILSIREVSHQISNNTLILNVKARHLGTAIEPVHLSNYANEKLEDNMLSLNHDVGRQVFNLPKLDKSYQSEINKNQNNTKSKEVLKLMIKLNVRLYINLETNMIVGWISKPKISSFEVNMNDI